jgi:predicted short-subunit dehydrogenase-like oxidoreductase (DUF2520 family)
VTETDDPQAHRPVAVVGAGRVGLYLARALSARGHAVSGVVVRSDAARARAAAEGFATLALDDVRVGQAGTLLLCVADVDLPGLVDLLGAGEPAQFVAHTSGRYGLGVLSTRAGPTAAVHPAMTFTGTDADLRIPADMAYGVTALGQGLVAAQALVADLGGRVELIPDERRPLYHAAMCHASNHLNTLIADASDLMRACGVRDTAAVLGPIALAALTNALALGTAALTGPVVRGDVGTVAAHLEALAGGPVDPTYRGMALRTADRAEAAGRLQVAAAQRIRALLAAGG